MPAPAPNAQQKEQQVPLKIVGGVNFGRYDKISDENTYNFIVSDKFLVPYAGYKRVVEIGGTAEGRSIYSSRTGNFMLAVIGRQVIRLNPGANNTINAVIIGNLETSIGDVFMAENNGRQICITDQVYLYIFDYTGSPGTLSSSAPGGTITFPFPSPGYVSFQNGRFIVASLGTQNWVLSKFNDGTDWPTNDVAGASRIGVIQSKPGTIQAAVPVPGGGNNLLIFGSNVAESWQDLGLAVFPYQRNSTFNVDFGCLNASSIAELDNFIVWLAVNEQSGPTIMYTMGNQTKYVSTDGIDFKMANLTNPSNCSGFLFKQDGHLLYQFTFPDDNLSYAYDFNSSLFFTVTDENLNYHIAREVAFFGNDFYFVSLKGGNVYRFGTQYTDAEYASDDIKELPRIRICPPLRLTSQRYFIARSLGFTIENGQPNHITTVSYQPSDTGVDITTEDSDTIMTEDSIFITTEADASAPVVYEVRSEAVDLSISRDGGETFGSSYRIEMNKTGKRKSRFIFQRLGIVNDMTVQLRFSGFGRFVCTDGEIDVYQ